MSLEKAIIRLVRQATDDRFNEILEAILNSREKSANSFHNLTTKVNKLTMSQKTEFDALIARLDAASNVQAENMKALRDQVAELIANKGLSLEEENQIKAAFDAPITFLEALGKKENPVPEPTPTEPAPPVEEPSPVETPAEPTPDAPAEGGDVTPPVTEEEPA